MACTRERSGEIGEFAAGRLDAAASAALLDHLEGCPECSTEFDLVADLLAASGREGRSLFPARRPRLRALRGVGGLLATAAAVVLAVVLSRPGPRAPAWDELASTAPLPAASALLRSETAPPRPPAYLEAMDLYARGEFAAAGEGLAAFLSAEPGDPLASLYLGVCRLQTAAPRAAIEPLRRAAEGGEGLLRERALWYLGNAHLAAGEGEAALEAFERLEALAGDYEPNAREKAREIREALDRR